MNRRGFLKMLGLGVGAIALEQTVPFGRVYSFPSKIIIASGEPFLLKFVRAWNPEQSKVVSRFDLLYGGVAPLTPRAGEFGQLAGFEWDEETSLYTHEPPRLS